MAKKKAPAVRAGAKAERKMAARAERRTVKTEAKRAREIAKMSARLEHVRELRAAADALIGSLEGRLRELSATTTPAEAVAVAPPMDPGASSTSRPIRRTRTTARARPTTPRRPRRSTPPVG